MHPGLSSYVMEALRSIRACRDLEIVRSTLIVNEEWKSPGGRCELEPGLGFRGP